MTTSSRAPLYDLFKLIVAIILLLIFLFLWIGRRSVEARPLEPAPATTLSSTETLPPTPTTVPASSTSIPPTETPAPTTTPTPTITSTPPATSTTTPTSVPSITPTPISEPISTPIVEIPTETDVCEAYSRSQLQVGMKATIVRYLNLRSSPGILQNWILTNSPGMQVEIIGGPECTRYQGGGAYLWWQIKLPNGIVGWSAEASASGGFYFMEPVR